MNESRQFLYQIKPKRLAMLTDGPTEEESAILNQHFTYLKHLTEQGIVYLAGRTLNNDETTFGIVIFQSDSEQSAQRIMQEDPAVKHGIMRATLYPYEIALMKERH